MIFVNLSITISKIRYNSVYSHNVYYMYSLSLTKYCIIFNTRRVYLLHISSIIIHASSLPKPGKVVTLRARDRSNVFIMCALAVRIYYIRYKP